jgi:hypothetical protein
MVACGNNSAERLPAAEAVARQFLADGDPPAPTPELAADLKFLNDCTAKRIRESDISYEDTQDEITTKVQAFMQQCQDERYGKEKG